MNKVLVVGSINIDQIFELDRFPKKGETVSTHNIKRLLGGKGTNQAVSAARLGADVSMIGCVGDNPNGESVLRKLVSEGINVEGIQKVDVETGSAVVMLHDNDNRIIINPGANGMLDISWITKNIHLIDQSDVILLQFEIPMDVIEFVAEYAYKKGKQVIVNPAPAAEISSKLMKCFTLITPNESEFLNIFKLDDLTKMTEVFQGFPSRIIVTMGEHGVAFSSEDGRVTTYSAHKVDVVDTTGAGDTFNGALAYAFSNGMNIADAVKLANKASSISVQSVGAQTGMPTMKQLMKKI